MTYSLNTLNADRDAGPEPTGWRRFAQEMALTVGFLFLAFWLLALISHHPGDSAWTTSGAGAVTRNAAGRLGALISDIGFFMLGYSIWWSYGAALSVWVRALLQRLRNEGATVADVPWRHTKSAFWSGLAMLLLSSAALEWSRLYRFEDQLAGSISGGVVGYFIGPVSEHWLGFNGAGLVFIALMLVGASWVFRFSWVQVAQYIGASIDGFVASWREKRELAQDLAMGQAAARERDEIITESRPDMDEPTAPAVNIEAVVLDVPKSTRVAKERQRPLFQEMPDSHLPQVDLLDGALTRQDTVSSETMEMTSRMIE